MGDFLLEFDAGPLKDLLRRVQSALPEVRTWIEDLHARYSPFAVPPSSVGFTRLLDYFPESVLRTARSTIVDDIPFPPVSSYGLPEFESLAKMPMAGITFDGMYFVQRSHSVEHVHFYELIHVVQWDTLGVNEFLLTYALGIAQHGHMQSPLEAVAYDLQDQFEKGATLSRTVESRSSPCNHYSKQRVKRVS